MRTQRHLSLPVAALIIAATTTARSETYQSWAATHFTPAQITAGLAAPNQDPDGDLCPNIHEYAADCLPLDPGSHFSATYQFDASLGEVTVAFPFSSDRADIEYLILVSKDLQTWSPRAVFVCEGTLITYHLNGHAYAKIGIQPKPGMMMDSDHDGLSDHFEESLVNSAPDDSFAHIGQIQPDDDFDGDGTANIDEPGNHAASPTFTAPSQLDPLAVACALDRSSPPPPDRIEIHTPLK